MTAAGPVLDPLDPGAVSGRSRSRYRELTILLACVAVAVTAVVLGVGSRGGSSRAPAAGRPTSAVGGLTSAQRARQRAISSLLARRSAGLLHHNRAEFAATLDPGHPAFRRSQLRMFANMAKVSFSHWSCEFSPTSTPQQEQQVARYGVPAFAPADFAERYSLSGFDPVPAVLTEYPTFVERSGGWYLTSFADDRARHEVSDTQIWDYGPVDVVHRARVLVLGPPSELATMRGAATAAVAGIPRVTAVWGSHWSQRVVIQLPLTQQEMGRITDDAGDLHRIAALTSTETSAGNGGPTPVGDRVTLNPAIWPHLSPTGVEVVVTHELTHVASRPDTGDGTPKWLSEGFADYVGYLDVDLASSQIAPELTGLVRTGKVPRGLPPDRAFDGANAKIADAYDEGWMACRYVAANYGQSQLVRFYRAVGTGTGGPRQAVARALKSVLHLTPHQFLAAWHRYLRQQL